MYTSKNQASLMRMPTTSSTRDDHEDCSSCTKNLADATAPIASSASSSRDITLSPSQDSKKRVRWSTVTVYEFGVAMGGSAVPRRGGPSIGLARKPKTIWSAAVDDIEVGTLDDDEKWIEKLPTFCSKEDEEKPKAITPAARRRRVRWLKPLERVQLLTNAGCSEKRIYRMMMESSEIAMSRRLSVSVQRDIAV